MTIKTKLDVVITATVRADILRLTLASFCKKFLYQFDCRIIINVDPVGELEKNTQMDMVNICREYFDEVFYRTPSKASFSAAVQWGWQQVNTEFFLHLEDDWILKENITPQQIMKVFDDNDVGSYVLNRIPNQHKLKSVSLNPGLFRTAFIKKMLLQFDTTKDPEFQFGKVRMQYPNDKIILRESNNAIVIDSGRIWRRKMFIGKGDSITNPTWYARKPIAIKYIMRTIYYEFYKHYWRIKYC